MEKTEDYGKITKTIPDSEAEEFRTCSENNTPKITQWVRLKKYTQNNMKSLPLKMTILAYSAGVIAILPFLVLQMQLIGLSINEIGFIYLLTPIASIIGPVASGLIADRTGKYKLVFGANVILTAICYNMLHTIPHIEYAHVEISCESAQETWKATFLNCSERCDNLIFNKNNSDFAVKNCKSALEFKNTTVESFEYVHNVSARTVDHLCDTKFQVNISTRIDYCTFQVNQITQLNKNPTNALSCEDTSKIICDFDSVITRNPCLTDIVSQTFIAVFTTMFCGSFFIGAAFTMLDATTLQYTKEHQISLGRQKVMTMFGYGVTPLLAGIILDYDFATRGVRSYLPTFIMSNICLGIACTALIFIKIKAEKEGSKILKDLKRLITTLEVDLFLIVVLILGCNFGFIESYLFIYLKSLDAPNILLGMTVTVGSLSSIPVLFCYDWIQKKVGRHLIFFIGFTTYATRMLGYSFIVNPWMALIFEMLESITYQMIWVNCLSLCPILAPAGMLATMTGITGSIHYSFGRGIGGFIGGRLISAYGMRNAYRIFAGVALAGGIFYLIIHYTVLKKKIEQKEKDFNEIEQRKRESDFKNVITDIEFSTY